MIIGKASFSEVASTLFSAQETLGREVNPKIFRRREWARLEKDDDNFIKEAMTKPRMDVLGRRDELG